MNPTYDAELLLIRWFLLRRQLFGKRKQLHADRIGGEFTDWTYHTATHTTSRLSNCSILKKTKG